MTSLIRTTILKLEILQGNLMVVFQLMINVFLVQLIRNSNLILGYFAVIYISNQLFSKWIWVLRWNQSFLPKLELELGIWRGLYRCIIVWSVVFSTLEQASLCLVLKPQQTSIYQNVSPNVLHPIRLGASFVLASQTPSIGLNASAAISCTRA